MHGMRRSGVAVARNATSTHPLSAAWKRLLPTASDEGQALHARAPHPALGGSSRCGFVFGALGISRLFGPGAGFPRFDGIDYLRLDANALWAFLALPLGWVLARLSAYVGRRQKLAFGRMKTVPKAILCGIVLEHIAMALQCSSRGSPAHGPSQRLAGRERRGAAYHLRGKACPDTALRETGWVGGEFFPTSSAALPPGCLVAAITGGDPCSPVAARRAPGEEPATRKWLLSTCVLALCFRPQACRGGACGVSQRKGRSGHSRS